MERLVNEELDRKDDDWTAWLCSDDCAAEYAAIAGAMEEADRRRRADAALRAKAVGVLVELTEHPFTREYVLGRLIAPRNGRPPRHGFEYLTTDKAALLLASLTVDSVREIWKLAYPGQRNRTADNGPSAEDIVVRRFEKLGVAVDPEALANWRRKYSRKSRR
jgi:hypothetical protein